MMRRSRRSSRRVRVRSLTRMILSATGIVVFLLGLPIMAVFFIVALLTGLWWPLPWMAIAIVSVSLVTVAGLASGVEDE